MKVTVKTAQLQELADIATRFVSKHSTLPILENIYIKGVGDVLTIKATDMEKYVNVELQAKIEAEWALTVNAKMFTDIIKMLEDEYTTLHIDQSKDKLLIKTASDSFSMKGIPAQEYVAIPEVRSDVTINLAAKDISTGIWKVEYAVTEKNFSPVLTGIFMKLKQVDNKNKLFFVGSDSFRLAEYTITTQGEYVPFEIIIPKTTCNDLKKVIEYYIGQGGEEIDMKFAENLVSFVMKKGDISLTTTSLLIQGAFPDYDNENIIPTTGKIKLQVDKSALDKAIKKILIITRDINNYVLLNATTDTLVVTSEETDRGDAQSSMPAVMQVNKAMMWPEESTPETVWEWVALQSDKISFWLNGKYVADFLRSIESPDIRFHIINTDKPVVLYDPQDPAYRYVVRTLNK